MLVMNKNDVKTNEKTSAMVGRRCIMCVYVGGVIGVLRVREMVFCYVLKGR